MNLPGVHQVVILEHARRPQHHGLREPYLAEVEVANPVCGDRITLRVDLAGITVRDVSYVSLGCAVSCASASVMADLVIGHDLSVALAIRERFLDLVRPGGGGSDALTHDDEVVLGDGVAFVGVARRPARHTCATLAWTAFADAVQAATGELLRG